MKEDTSAISNQSSRQSQPAVKDRRLHGIWLWLMRILFAGTYVGLLYFYIVQNIPIYKEQGIQTSDIFIDIINGCIAIIALLVFLRKSDDWFVILSALAVFLFPAVLASNNEIAPDIGLSVLILFSYLFPNGQFTPKWMGAVCFVSIFLLILGGLAFDANIPYLSNYNLEPLEPIGAFIASVGIVYSQIYSYKYISTRLERQQTKWVVIGISVFFMYLILDVVIYLGSGSISWLQYLEPYNQPQIIIPVCSLFFAITVLLAIYGYGLWDVDFYLNRTLLYGAVTGLLAIVWALTIALLGYVIQQVTKQSSPLVATLISSVQVAALFQPVRQRLEKWINNRFYKDRIDFDEAIIELQRENWQFLSSQDMFNLLATKSPRLLKSMCGTIYSYHDSKFNVVEAIGIDRSKAQNYIFDEVSLAELKNGNVVRAKDEDPFALLVPLTMPRQHVNDLIGVLALGPRVEDQGYSRDHIADLRNLGKRAGTAIHFLQLNEKKSASA